MIAITRGRSIAAAGFLAASTLLGTALAAGPAMDHEGHAAMQQDAAPRMQQDAAPRMQQDAAPRMQQDAAPRMQQDGTLTAARKARPAPWDVVKLTAVRKTRPAPWDDAVPAPWEI